MVFRMIPTSIRLILILAATCDSMRGDAGSIISRSKGRSLMIPGYLGTNIEGVLHPERREALSANWNKLPKTVSSLGTTPEELFACYFDLQQKIGKDEIKNIPYGAIAFWTLTDKLGCGLQQLMAGARKFAMQQVTRNDLFSANRETEKETGITHCADVNDEFAKKILSEF